MSTYLAAELRQQLLEADDQRCAYCQTTQANSGYPMTVDHALNMNNEVILDARRNWVSVGWHPPGR